MPDLHDLDVLLTGWQQYLASHEAGPETKRSAGFHAALEICVKQLAETLERVKADA